MYICVHRLTHLTDSIWLHMVTCNALPFIHLSARPVFVPLLIAGAHCPLLKMPPKPLKKTTASKIASTAAIFLIKIHDMVWCGAVRCGAVRWGMRMHFHMCYMVRVLVSVTYPNKP